MIDPAALPPRAARLTRVVRLRGDAVLLVLVGAAVAWLALAPLCYLLWRAFVEDGGLTSRYLGEAFGVVGLGRVLGDTAIFATGSTALGLALGAALAFLLVRTDLPWARVLFGAALAPLLLSGVLVTIAWIFLAAPRTGLLNRALEPVFGEGALDVFGLGGMIVVEALRLVPLALLLTAAALRVVDPALEASAVVSGVPRRVAVRRITLALVRPALLAAGLLLALRSIEAFEVPTLLGLPAGVWVFTSRIWLALDRPDGSLGPAAAGAVPLLVLTVVGTVALAASTRRRRSFETISPRGHRAERIALGRWRLPALAAVLAYLALAVALPLGALVWVSTQPFLAGVSDDALARANLDGYEELLRNETTRRSIVNSLTYGASTATVAVALAALVAFVAVRTRIRGRLLLDTFAFLPIAVPGLVLGAGVLFLYVRLPIGVYGTAALLVIGLVTRYLPYGVRFAGAGMAQLGRELEEAARVSGVRGRRAFVGVTLPLVAPALLAAWATVFVLSLHDVSTSLLLYSPGTEVVSVRTWDLYEAGASQQVAALGVVTGAAGLALGAAAFALGAAAVRRSRARG